MAIKGVYNINEMSKVIAKELSLYSDTVKEQVEEIEKQVAKRAVKMLRVAGSFENHRQNKNYRKTWRAKKTDRGWVVHNTSNYQLTHLLEKGHATRNGGRTRAFPHIKPVEQRVIKEFEKEIRDVLGE